MLNQLTTSVIVFHLVFLMIMIIVFHSAIIVFCLVFPLFSGELNRWIQRSKNRIAFCHSKASQYLFGKVTLIQQERSLHVIANDIKTKTMVSSPQSFISNLLESWSFSVVMVVIESVSKIRSSTYNAIIASCSVSPETLRQI